MYLRSLLFSCFSVLCIGLAAGPGAAFSPPEGPVILTVTGVPGSPAPVAFDLALLEALPVVEFTTTTIWTDGPQRFAGVPLAALLAHLGIEDGTVRAIAANDYAVEIPVSSVTETTPILAYMQNDAPMSRRDRGPIWVVYPYDSDPSFRTEVIYSRSIWQLDRIELMP